MRGDRLRYLRHSRDMSQEDVAERIGVTAKQLRRWENGQAAPGADNVTALAKLFDVSTDFLHGITDEPYPIYEQSDLSPMEQKLIGALRAGQMREAMRTLLDIDDDAPIEDVETKNDA